MGLDGVLARHQAQFFALGCKPFVFFGAGEAVFAAFSPKRSFFVPFFQSPVCTVCHSRDVGAVCDRGCGAAAHLPDAPVSVLGADRGQGQYDGFCGMSQGLLAALCDRHPVFDAAAKENISLYPPQMGGDSSGRGDFCVQRILSCDLKEQSVFVF